MNDPARPVLSRYGVACIAVLLVTCVRLALHPALGNRQPFVTLVLAVIVTAWYGGFGPSILALGLGGISGTYFLLSTSSGTAVAWVADVLGVGLYLAVGSAVVAFGQAGRAARVRLEGEVAERRRAEEALRESEGRLRGLMEQAPFSIQVLSPDGRTLGVNRAWEDLWGLTLDQVADYNVLEDPQLKAKGILGPIRRAFDGEVSAIPAIRYDPNETLPGRTRHDDPGRWITALAYPLKDDAGRIREVVLVHEDISGRRKAEEAIRASERRFRHLADAMPQLVWVTRPDRSVEYVNRRWLEFTGQSPKEALGEGGWVSAVHPDDIGRIVEASIRSHSTGEPFEAEYRIKDASGAYRWHLGRAVSIFDGDGRLVRRFGAATDIEDRRRVERNANLLAEVSATLAAVEDEAVTLQRVARLAVPSFADWCAVDLAGVDGLSDRLAVAHVDPAKLELAHDLHRRYPPDPDARSGVPHVIRSGEPEMVAEITDEFIVDGARDEGHLRLLRELGPRSYLCVPLRGRGGTLGALTFVAAESGRRYSPDDLRLAEDLASRAGIAIENARLYAELREADRKKDDFLATLAHELRNPLAPVRNALHMMRGRDADEVEADRAMAERQVTHLATLVDDLMDVARIRRGKIGLRREIVDLGPAVRHAVEAVRSMAEGRGHELNVSMPSRPILVDVDPTRLDQVLGNLLSNACKYTDRGGRVGLSARFEDGEAVIRVSDTGIGIAPEMLPKIFEMFAQAGDPTNRPQGGLGIGLGLARSLVELHGGSITAHSEGPGKGSEFAVRLPARRSGSGDPVGPVRGRDAEPGGLPRRRVLVVDDNVDAAVSLGRLLTRLHGQEVRIAHDGPSALEVADEFRPELAILDIGMPGMDGHEVARRMRGRPEFRETLIVALTGWGQEEDRRRSSEAGFDRHLVKPASPEALLELLSKAGKGDD